MMETTITLPASSLSYYANAKIWVDDLDYFKVENTFMNRMLDDYSIPLTDVITMERVRLIGQKLIKLQADKSYSDTILSELFINLKLVAEEVIPENIAELAYKQMELEYLITNLNSGYREIKRDLLGLLTV
jgi:hypothetical protein